MASSRKKKLDKIIEMLSNVIDDKAYRIEIITTIKSPEALETLERMACDEKVAFVIPRLLKTAWAVKLKQDLFRQLFKNDIYIDGFIIFKNRSFSFEYNTTTQRGLANTLYTDETGKNVLECVICLENYADKVHYTRLGLCKCAAVLCTGCLLDLLLNSIDSNPFYVECPGCRQTRANFKALLNTLEADKVAKLLYDLKKQGIVDDVATDLPFVYNSIYRLVIGFKEEHTIEPQVYKAFIEKLEQKAQIAGVALIKDTL